MAKTVGFSDAWAKHEERWRETEDRYSEIPRVSKLEPRDIGNGRTRWVYKDSAIGVESTIHHVKGQRINTLKEVPVGNGDIDTYYQLRDDNGQSRGTVVQRWHKIAEGIHRAGEIRHTRSF